MTDSMFYQEKEGRWLDRILSFMDKERRNLEQLHRMGLRDDPIKRELIFKLIGMGYVFWFMRKIAKLIFF